MTVDILMISSLWVAGWCGHLLYQDLCASWQKSRQVKRQRREDDEVLRIVSGLEDTTEPEVDVASEEIKPTWRERLADWWAETWLRSTPRTHDQLTGFTSYAGVALRGGTRLDLRRVGPEEKSKPSRYTGTHRATKALDKEGKRGMPVSQEAISG